MKLTYTSIKYATWIVLLHVLVNVLHGLAHFENSTWLSLFGNAYVTVVIFLAPLLALLLLYSRWQRQGAWLLALSMLGALIFGLWNHFIVSGPDNVAQVPPGPWHLPFLITSILLALLEATGTAIGVWCLISNYSEQATPRQSAFGASSGQGTPDSRA
jgi:hypothetical protein